MMELEIIENFLTEEVKNKLLSCDCAVDAFILGIIEANKKSNPNISKIVSSFCSSLAPTIQTDALGGHRVLTIPNTGKGIVIDGIMFSRATWEYYQSFCKNEDWELPDLRTGYEISRNMKAINYSLDMIGHAGLPSMFWGEDFIVGLKRLGITNVEYSSNDAWCWDKYYWISTPKSDALSLVLIIDL